MALLYVEAQTVIVVGNGNNNIRSFDNGFSYNNSDAGPGLLMYYLILLTYP